jgi:flagellar biosynthetic protein FliR
VIDVETLLSIGLRGLAILSRVGFILFFMPVLGEAFTPVRARLLLALGLSACLVPVVDVDLSLMPTSITGLALALMPEFILGFALGLIARMVFAGVQFAGQFAGEQIGFGIANVIDPTSSAQISITAQVYFLFALLFFLALNGHHILISALVVSFEMVPLFTVHLPWELLTVFNDNALNMFALGVTLAAPITAATLIANLSLGLVAKAVPQINIFIESFPIRIALGLFIMGVTFTAVGVLLADQFARLDGELLKALQLLG